MLDVNCGIYVDSGPQKLLHILVPLRVAAAGRITVSQLIHQISCGFRASASSRSNSFSITPL